MFSAQLPDYETQDWSVRAELRLELAALPHFLRLIDTRLWHLFPAIGSCDTSSLININLLHIKVRLVVRITHSRNPLTLCVGLPSNGCETASSLSQDLHGNLASADQQLHHPSVRPQL